MTVLIIKAGKISREHGIHLLLIMCILVLIIEQETINIYLVRGAGIVPVTPTIYMHVITNCVTCLSIYV